MRIDGDLDIDGAVTLEGVRVPAQNTDTGAANRIFSGGVEPTEPVVGDIWVTGDDSPSGGTSDPLLMAGNMVAATYMTTAVSGVAADGWYFDNAGTPQLIDFTGRVCSVMWQGTSAQIPAQGTAAGALRSGDVALVRASSL